MQFKFCMSHVHAYFMHTLFLFLSSLYLVVIVFFSLSLSWIDCAMAPRRKSTLGWNPFQGSGSSSSSDPIPLLHIWFHDGKAQQDFLENF